MPFLLVIFRDRNSSNTGVKYFLLVDPSSTHLTAELRNKTPRHIYSHNKTSKETHKYGGIRFPTMYFHINSCEPNKALD